MNETNTLTETYEGVKNAMFRSINRIARRSAGVMDKADMESLSNEVFMRCVVDYDPAKGCLAKRCRAKLEFAILSEIRARRKRNTHHEQFGTDYAAATRFDLRRLILHVSEDAKIVLDAILGDVGRDDPKMSRMGIRDKVSTILKRAGWTSFRLGRTFEEIEEAIHERSICYSD